MYHSATIYFYQELRVKQYQRLYEVPAVVGTATEADAPQKAYTN